MHDLNDDAAMPRMLAELRLALFVVLHRSEGKPWRDEFVALLHDVGMCAGLDVVLAPMQATRATVAEVERDELRAAMSPAARALLRAAWSWYRSRDQIGPRGELRLAAQAYDHDHVARRALAALDGRELSTQAEVTPCSE